MRKSVTKAISTPMTKDDIFAINPWISFSFLIANSRVISSAFDRRIVHGEAKTSDSLGAVLPRKMASSCTVLTHVPAFLSQSFAVYRACRRTPSEVIDASDLSSPLSFSFRFHSDSIQYPDFLLGQCHQIPHEFVQIE